MNEYKQRITALVLVFVLMGCMALVSDRCQSRCSRHADTISVHVDSVRDTVYVVHHDTVPVVRHERVVQYVNPSTIDLQPSTLTPTPSDSMPVVQREYTDDSTYIAYVSGLRYNQWPKLDSIIVRQREITNTITKTVTIQKKRSRLSVGVQAGYGYGFQYRGFEPYVGIGVGYALFPP